MLLNQYCRYLSHLEWEMSTHKRPDHYLTSATCSQVRYLVILREVFPTLSCIYFEISHFRMKLLLISSLLVVAAQGRLVQEEKNLQTLIAIVNSSGAKWKVRKIFKLRSLWLPHLKFSNFF